MNRRRTTAVALAMIAAGLASAAPAGEPSSSNRAGTVERYVVGGSGGWDYLAFDPAHHRLFITRGDRVQAFDASKLAVTQELAGTEGVHGVALAPDRGVGLTSNGASGTVTVFDLETLGPVARIAAVGDGPDAIVYDRRSRRAFVFNGRSRDAAVIDLDAMRVVGTVPLPGRPEFAVSDDAGSVFVNIEDRNLIARIDVATSTVVAQWPLPGCDGPAGLAIDAAHRRLFASCSNRVLLAIDASTGAIVAHVTIGAGSDAVAFDPGKSLVLSSNRDGTLSVVREDGPDHYTALDSVATRAGARTLALDPATHRAYLVTSDFEPAPVSSASGTARARPVAKPGTFAVLVVDLSGIADR